MSPELDSLFQRLVNNDRSALKTIYDRTSPVVYGLFSLSLQSTEDREDALCKTYVEVWNRRKERANISGGHDMWVYNIAKTIALKSDGARPSSVSGEDFAHITHWAGMNNHSNLSKLEQNERMLLLTAYLSSAPVKHLSDRFDIKAQHVPERLATIIRKMRGLDK